MNINVDYESTAKRRLIIATTIIPFTLFVACEGAYMSRAQRVECRSGPLETSGLLRLSHRSPRTTGVRGP
jgi:hypothetical protein